MVDDRELAPLVPILVDGSGRDGTTLAMQLLGTSTAVAFDRVYPYEQRYLSYLMHWARTPTREWWDETAWNLDSLAHNQALQQVATVGPLPWPDRSLLAGAGEQPVWRSLFDAAWAEFSARARAAVRERLGDEALDVRYYAQKTAESWTLPFDQLPPLRLLCLLRDPRDTWVSSVAFHNRRLAEGNVFLPIAPEQPVEAALDRFLVDQRLRLRWLLGVEAELEAAVVRYESLALDLSAEAGRLSEWLGLHLDAAAVQLRREEFARHITAGSVERSAGRWRGEMESELAARFWAEMGAELAELGYEP